MVDRLREWFGKSLDTLRQLGIPHPLVVPVRFLRLGDTILSTPIGLGR